MKTRLERFDAFWNRQSYAGKFGIAFVIGILGTLTFPIWMTIGAVIAAVAFIVDMIENTLDIYRETEDES